MIRAGALLLTAVVGLVAWLPMLGPRVLWIVPVLAVAVGTVAAGRFSPRLALAMQFVWPPAALLAGGVPAGWFWPEEWGTLLRTLADGPGRLLAASPGEYSGGIASRSVWLLCAGLLYMTVAAMAAPREPGPVRLWPSFVLAATPWAMAAAIRQSDATAWPGAVLLLAALLWFAPRRTAVPVLVLGTATAMVATFTAQALGPHSQWLDVDAMFGRKPQFRTLNTQQSYGPIDDRRTGRTMLEITSPRPALWRMQVLERFSWRGWEVGGGVVRPDLPQPAAETVEVQVKVRGLRDSQAVSPGRILSVDSPLDVDTIPGSARRLVPQPKEGATYTVRADIVRPTPTELRNAPTADGLALNRYTGLWHGLGGPARSGVPDDFTPDTGFTPPDDRHRFPSLAENTPLGEVFGLARRLADGAGSQYEIVERVENHLTGGGRFRYSTDIESPEGLPLIDFLTRSRTGYCQHFAGAAAMLLRLAGVPTRVVAGFATGRLEDGVYNVRDTDAHAWIEVYFEGYGWVPFDPTPAGDAEVAAGVDPLDEPTPAPSRDRSIAAPAAGIGLALAGALALTWRRRSRRDGTGSGELLERLAARTGEPVTPGTTLRDLHDRLERIGPHLARAVADAESARFAPGPAPPVTRWRIVRALAADVGTFRAVWFLATPHGPPGRLRDRGSPPAPRAG